MGTSGARVEMNQHKRTFDATEKAGIKMSVTDLQWCLESFRIIQQDKWNGPILMMIELPFYIQVLVESFIGTRAIKKAWLAQGATAP